MRHISFHSLLCQDKYFLFSKPGSNYQYLPVTDVPGKLTGSRLPFIWSKYRKPSIVMLSVGLQFLLSSFLWNHFMFRYHVLLETDVFSSERVNRTAVLETQNEVLRSSAMWMVSYFWRLTNPQTMTQYQLLALLYSRECELVTGTQLLGFLPVTLVAAGSLTHLTYATHLVRAAAIS